MQPADAALLDLLVSLRRFCESCSQSFELKVPIPGPAVSRSDLQSATHRVHSLTTKIGLLFAEPILPEVSLAEPLLGIYQSALGDVCVLLSSVLARGERILRTRIHDEGVAFFTTVCTFIDAICKRCQLARSPVKGRGVPLLDPSFTGMVWDRCASVAKVELTNAEAVTRRVEQYFSQITDAQREITEVLERYPDGIPAAEEEAPAPAAGDEGSQDEGEDDGEDDDFGDDMGEDKWTAAEFAAVPVVGLLIKVGSSLLKKILTAVIPAVPPPPLLPPALPASAALSAAPATPLATSSSSSSSPSPSPAPAAAAAAAAAPAAVPAGSSPAAQLDSLEPLCARCAEAADRLLVALYPPQDVAALGGALMDYVGAGRALLAASRQLADAVERAAPGAAPVSVAWVDVVEKLLAKGELDFRTCAEKKQ